MSIVGTAGGVFAGSTTNMTTQWNSLISQGLTSGDDVWLYANTDGTNTIQFGNDWAYFGSRSFGGDGQTAIAMRLTPGAVNGVGGTPGYAGVTPDLALFNTNGATAGSFELIALRGRNLAATVLGLNPNSATVNVASPQNVVTNAISPSGGEDAMIYNVIDTTGSTDTWNVTPPGGFTEQAERQGVFYLGELATQTNLSSGSGVTYTSTYTIDTGSNNLAGYYSIVVAVPAAGGPTITGSPSDAHVAVGGSATISGSATASGGGTLTWKLQQNGVDVSGATGSGGSASYNVTSLALSDDLSVFTIVFTETGGTSPGTATTAGATVYVGWRVVGRSTPVITAANAASVAPSYSTLPTILAGDKIVLVIMMKPSSANSGSVTTPTGFTAIANVTAQGGYSTTLGNGTGNTNIFVFDKDVVAGTETGTLTVSLSTSNMSSATFVLLRAPPGTSSVSYANTTGGDSTAGNVSITGAGDPGVNAGDIVLMLFSAANFTPTYSAQTITQTGVTYSTGIELAEPGSATSNDIAGFIAWSKALSGTSSGAPTFTATVTGTNTNARGGGIALRVRAVASSVSDFVSGQRKERRGNPAYYLM